jgi:hypothetical protein
MLYRCAKTPTLSHKTRKSGAPSGFEIARGFGVDIGATYCSSTTRMRPSEWYPPPVAFLAPCTGSGGK